MSIQKVLKLSVAIVLATGGVSGAWADVGGPGTRRVSLDVGGAFPTPVNNFSDSTRMGLVGGVQYLYNLNYFAAVGIQVDGYRFDGKEHTLNEAAGGQLNATSQANAASFELMGRYTFQPAARFMPYAHAGLGANVLHQTTDGQPVAGSTWVDTNTSEARQLPNVNSVGITFSFGAGVETNLSDRVVLGLEAAWRILGVSKAAYGTSTLNIPSIAMRLGWRFGQEPLPPGD